MNSPIIPTVVLDAATSLAEFAVNWFVQSTALIAIGFLIIRVLSRGGAAFQSAAYRTILVAVLICPLATCGLSQFGVSGWSVRFPASLQSQPTALFGEALQEGHRAGTTKPPESKPPESTPTIAASANAAGGEGDETAADGLASIAAVPAGLGNDPPTRPQSVASDALGTAATAAVAAAGSNVTGMLALLGSALWLGIALLIFLRLISAYRKLDRLHRDALPADGATKHLCSEVASQLNVRVPEVRRSPFLPSPCLAGILRPAILLPEVDPSLPLREVLIHELAHLKRHDCHWNLVRHSATAAFFFQPLLWLLSRQIELAAEEVCDDYVVALGGDRNEYAHRLVDLAELSCVPIAPACVGIVSLRSMLAGRVSRIMDTSRALSTRISNLLLVSVMTAGLLATLVVGMIGITPRVNQAVAADVPGAKPAPKSESFTLSGRVVNADGQPVSNAVVKIATGWERKLLAQPTTAADGTFEASVPVKREALSNLRIQASSPDSSQMGYYRFSYDSNRAPIVDALEVKLAPVKNVRIKVVDADGSPITDARVAMELPFPHTLTGMTTNQSGECAVQLPQSERIETVIAWKDHVGLDYRGYVLARGQQADENAKAPEFPAEGIETLTLDGAAPLTVVLKDEQQLPIEGVPVYPWLLKKESQPQELNLSFFTDILSATSDKEGKAVFNWLPSWHKSIIQLWPTTSEHAHARGIYDPSTGSGVLEMQLVRLVPIRGQVTGPDGKPQAGINVLAMGSGYTFDAAFGSATTDELGRYEIKVSPDQIFLVLVTDKQWASSPQDGFAVFKSQPVEGKDFVLRKATRVFGQLIDQETEQPIAGESVYVYQYGQDLNSLKIDLPNPENSRKYVRPTFASSAKTDAEGRFEFSLGDGQFDIRPPRQEKADAFEIKGQEELELRVTTTLHKEVELVGKVVTKADQSPVAAAQLEGVPRTFSGREWRATTVADGTFRVKRSREPTYVHAISGDKQQAGIAQLDERTPTVTVELQPVGSATARLLTTDSQGPLAGTKISYGIKVPDPERRTWSYRFGGAVTTGADGSFRLDSLVPGEEYTLSLEPTSEGIIPTLTKLTVEPGQALDLKDLPAPVPPKRYVAPTLEERIRSAFEVAGTPLERLTRAGELIQLSNQHLLIVFGAVEDPRIHRLMDIRFNDPDFRPLSDEFRFMAIPTENELRGPADELAKKVEEPLDEDRAKFLIVLLDRDLKKVAAADSQALCVDGELSKEKLFELLRQHLTQPLDARKLLETALMQAVEEDKRVIVQETATWCGPCYELSGFLDGHREWEKDFIWVKMDHRWTGAVELMAELRDGADGGIPWFAILDASGKKLITSNEPENKSNIGFPSDKRGRDHFFNMLNSTRKRLSEAEIRQLVNQLVEPKK